MINSLDAEPNGRALDATAGMESTPSDAPLTASIRECRPGDLGVASVLFSRLLRSGENCNLATLESYLSTLFFEHPWRDPQLPSLVSVSARGAITGFLGVLPVRMTYRGRPVRTALASALMVDSAQRDPTAGARLLRTFLGGPQDLSVSEHSNALAAGMWLRLGGVAVPAYSMDWLRILRPLQAGIALAKLPPWLAGLSRPAAGAVEGLLRTDSRRAFRLDQEDPRITRSGLDVDQLADLAVRFAAPYGLKPAWDASSLRWFLEHAAHKGDWGDLTARVVTGRNKAPLGCYLYYGRPGGVAFVLQIFSAPENAVTVVRSLLADVHALGCAAVRGRAQPDMLFALLQTGCIFKHGTSLTMHSRNEQLLAAVHAGDALLTGLAGEAWSRMNRGKFD